MASAPPSAEKILRIGVLQGGRILEERHLLRAQDVTIGYEGKNSFVVAGSDVPASFPLFELRSGRYQLQFDAKMGGRLARDGGDDDLDTLRRSADTARNGELWSVPLPETAKGTVSWGDVTILFQMVPPPVASVASDIPLNFKRPLWRPREPLFVASLVGSLLIHSVAAVYLALTPTPEEPDLALVELPDRFAKLLIPPPLPEPEKPREAEEAQKEKAKTEKRAAKPVDSAARRAEIQRKVASKGLLRILGAAGTSGAFEDVLGGDTGAGDIAQALAGAGGVGVATADSLAANGPKGAGAGDVAGIGDVGTKGGGKVNLGAKGDARVSGTVTHSAPEIDSSDVDRAALARYVKARLKAIQNCYEKELKRNPRLRGKVVVRFSINTQGRTSDIDIEENTLGNEAVGACIRTVIRAWVFPFKPDDAVPVAYPFVFSPAS
ncbi:MAG: TonB family protein [Myxococcaceae bacterium]